MTRGISAYAADSLLTQRALDFLTAAGPVDAITLVEYVCGLAGTPRIVAEQLSQALFAGRPEFVCDTLGRWSVTDRLKEPPLVVGGDTANHGAECAPSSQALASLSYVVVDVETTGSSPVAGDRITEIAAIVVRGGVVTERFETLINPERPIPRWITALTNISWDMVKDAPRFRDICDRLLTVLGGHVFVAHNAEFDWRFVTSELGRATGQRLAGNRLCTVRLARRLLPDLRSRRLDAVADYYGIDIPARHRAGGDAIATAHVLLRLLADARERDCQSWDDLQRLLGARTRSRRTRRRSAMPRPVDRDTTA